MDQRTTILDCSSPSTTERTLAALLGLPRRSLHAKCAAFNLKDFYDRNWGPARELPGRVLGLDLSDEPRAVYFFHATRVVPADGLFRDGILPLGEAVEVAWRSLWPLAEKYCSREEWQAFRRDVETDHASHNAWLYRFKTKDTAPSQHGPYGFLIRAIPLHRFTTSAGPWHDYLGAPEIVEDICVAFKTSFGGANLFADFSAASRPCLVKFRADGDGHDLATALLYLCHSIHGFELNSDLGSCHDAGGCLISPERIVAVEMDPQ